MAVPGRSVARPAPAQRGHGHADRGRDARSLRLLGLDDRRAGLLPIRRARRGRHGAAALLRHRRGDRHADPARAVPRGARQDAYVGGHPPPHRVGAPDGPRRSSRARDRCAGRGGGRWGHRSSSAGRDGRRRRRRRRGCVGRQREHGHRREHAGGQGTRRPGHRRHAQHVGDAHVPGDAGGGRHGPGADHPPRRPTPRGRALRSSVWPTW